MKPRYDKLYELGEDFSLRGRRFRAGPIDDTPDPWGLLHGTVKPRKAIRFGRRQGRSICDVIWTTHLSTLISKRFRDLLRTEGFTGWSTFPVKVYDEEGREVRSYFGLSITGRCARADNTRSKRIEKPPYYEGGPKIPKLVGMFFKDDAWDGSDIFVPEGTGYLIVTEQVKIALEQLDIPNVTFKRLSTIERELDS